MNPQELLVFLRGAGLQVSLAVFVLGMSYRVLYLLVRGRKRSLAVPRGSAWAGGLRTLWHRSFVLANATPRTTFTFVAGYLFHVGFLAVLFFLEQHIAMMRGILGFSWPAAPRSLMDISTVLALAALVALLVHRLIDPVKQLLSDFQDYLVWLLSFLPLLTGFMLLRGIGGDYATALNLHLASVELLLVASPFTKFTHMFSTFIARWHNGAMAGFKGTRA